MNPLATGFYGDWIGSYPGHFDEVCRIYQAGSQIICEKVTGDDYVPAGETTWQLDLETKQAVGQIAEKGYVNPRFVPAEVTILSRDVLRVQWKVGGPDENRAFVEFRRDWI